MREENQGAPTLGARKGAPKSRLDLSAPDDRMSEERGQQEREISEDREMTEDERLELFLDTQHQTVLPNLPVMDGFHVCWLTTSNPRDTIPYRRSIGYQLLRLEDCPGYQGYQAQDPRYADYITVNEMVAARIPLNLYNRMMFEVGHRQPLAEEEKLRSSTEDLARGARRRNIQVEEGDGTAEIVQRAEPMPVFSE